MYMNDGNKTKINLRNKSVFITGVAGFIGSNLAKRLLSTVEDVKVVGLDNMNHYYDRGHALCRHLERPWHLEHPDRSDGQPRGGRGTV